MVINNMREKTDNNKIFKIWEQELKDNPINKELLIKLFFLYGLHKNGIRSMDLNTFEDKYEFKRIMDDIDKRNDIRYFGEKNDFVK